MTAWDDFEGIYAPVIFRVAMGQGLQTTDAENVVQEVLLRVAKSVTNWIENQNRGPFRAWLIRIARNETLRLLSRQATRPWSQTSVSDNRLPLQTIAADDKSVSSELAREYQRELFLWAAEQVRGEVEEHTWLAFWWTHVEGMAIAVAAQRLKVRPGNIYFARSRVMNRLRLAVSQFEQQEEW